ncbi:MBL fold metallo-hydrolase [Sphingopyxis microcysteis]|uniref:MBL fold metallo-hydrolase n=1 Tax=Sphingopyxis microcysteis TaxID=2484145 RepID=UPI0014461D4E|nr:MBL fold metallo-hydrolase [Sphingopyxis microcysteis]
MISTKALLVIAAATMVPVTTAVHAKAESSGSKPSATQVITLGTGGGPSYRDKRAMSSNAVVVGKDVYLVDTGDGLMHRYASAELDVGQVKAVFITHHHFDHNADLGALLTFRWLANDLIGAQSPPLPVIGPPMTVGFVQHLAAAFRPTELAPVTIGGTEPGPIALTANAMDLPGDLFEPKVIYRDDKVTVTAVLNNHYHYQPGSASDRNARSYAFRFDTADRSIVFTGDTGPSPRVEALAQGADILVAEVIDLPSIERQWRSRDGSDGAQVDALIAHLRQDHLTPEDVGKMASSAKVGMVVLNHLVPGYDDETDPEIYARGVRRYFTGRVVVANDLDRF